MTCFSFWLLFCPFDGIVDQEGIIEIVKMRPIDRLLEIGKRKKETLETIKNILTQYEWFLKNTDQESSEMLKWIGDRANRDDAFRDLGFW
jgi:hypothetical protein